MAFVGNEVCPNHWPTQRLRDRSVPNSYHLGLLKAKLAKLRRELLAPSGGGGGAGGPGFDVARTGIASVGFVG